MDEENVSAHMMKISLVLSQRHKNGKRKRNQNRKRKRRAKRPKNSCMLWRSVYLCGSVAKGGSEGKGQAGSPGQGRAECGPTCCLATRAARPDAGFIIIVNMPTERGELDQGQGKG